MNGAEKIVSAMKKVSKSNIPVESNIVSATVLSTTPLVFRLENRLEIDSTFYELSNLEDWKSIKVGTKVRAFSFNQGQKYYISDIIEEKDYNLYLTNDTLKKLLNGEQDIKFNIPGSDIKADTIAGAIAELSQKLEGESLPIGSGMDYYGVVAPENYMFADGRAISRTDYAELFEIIGTTYGAGNGSTTFNLPDKRERVSVMRKESSTNGTSGATLGTLGAKGGEFKHTLTKSELPNISIEVTYQDAPVVDNKSANNDYNSNERTLNFMTNDSTSQSKVKTKNLGSGTAMNNMQPYLVCNYIIKVK